MAGHSIPAYKLNTTLEIVVDTFQEHNINRWFISYGTLLGIVRDNSCIDGDDDLDFCVDRTAFGKCLLALKDLPLGNFYVPSPRKIKNSFLRREGTHELSAVDLYCCAVDKEGSFRDDWENVTWTECYSNKESKEFQILEWHGRMLQVPNNYVEKLQKRYGPTWEQRIKRGAGEKSDGYRNNKYI